jgi:hypothetical protein
MNFKLKLNVQRDRMNFRSIQLHHLQPSPISGDYPFKSVNVKSKESNDRRELMVLKSLCYSLVKTQRNFPHF